MKAPAILAALILTLAACSTAPRTRVTISKDEARVETRGEVAKPATITRDTDGKITVTTPTTPEPPAPPTPADHAAAAVLKWYNLAAIALLIAAAVAAWRAYTSAAICLGVAAVAAPLLGNFGQSTAALVITAIFVAAALAYVSAWFVFRHKLSPDTPTNVTLS